MATENILIEFESDVSGLQPALDRLESLGKIDKATADSFRKTTAEMKNQQGAIGKLVTENSKLKKNYDDLSRQMKSFTQTFMKGFQQGVIAELKKAGVSTQDFSKALKTGFTETAKASNSLKSELRLLTEEMARLKIAGLDNTEQYKKLAAEAGHLQDSMADVRQEIRGVGSDTRVFDGLLSTVQGVAGGFAVAQGAAALFGDESKELQVVLMRVSAVMAVIQGLQQIQNTLQRESAASLLFMSAAQKANTAATAIATTVMRAFGLSTVQTSFAFKALRTALITTGIGALVVGLGFLVDKLMSLTSSSEDAAEAQKELAESMREAARAAKDAGMEFLNNEESLAVARASAAGKTELQIFNIQQDFLRKKIDAQERYVAQLSGSGDQQLAAEQELERLRTELQVNSIEKRAEILKKANEQIAKEAREKRLQDLREEIAKVKIELLETKKGSAEELALKKQVIALEAEVELEGEKLTEAQRLLIQRQAMEDQINLHREYNDKIRIEDIQAQIDKNSAELAQVELTNEQRLLLTIANIELAAKLEIDANKENAKKVLAIIAQREADVREVKLKAIQDQANMEISLQNSITGARKREIERTLADERLSLDQRIILIDELTQYMLIAGDRRLQALNESLTKGLISQQDYNVQYEELIDQQAKIVEDGEERKRGETKKTLDEQERANEQFIANTINTTQTAIQLLDALYSLQSEKENNKIAEQRKNLEDLKNAGAITEKEAIARAKKIDAEERKIKQQQAQRDKNIAVFNALIGIPVAYLRGLKDGGLPLAIIYGALAAAQAVIVASRPLPKFRTGKKDSYEGFGEVGEAGAELIEKDGKMFVADKPTVVWLGKKDKVYTPAETKTMMKQMPHNDKQLMSVSHSTNNLIAIDYEKFGDEVAKKIPQTILNITEKGMSELVKQGNSYTEYLEKRRKW